jgi:hypothetical protein
MTLWLACAPPEGIENTLAVRALAHDGDAVVDLVAAIDAAGDSVRLAIPGDVPDVRSALERAADAGRIVEVVVDVDRAGALADSAALHGYTATLVDPAVSFFDFGVNLDVAWTGDQVVQSNAWAVLDDATWWVASGLGTAAAGTVIVAEMTGEHLVRDVLGEHNQLLGGTDATSMDAYSGLNKSLTDLELRYPLDGGETLHFGFGPQERLVKQVTDAVYRTRGSIRLATDDCTDPGLQYALLEAAEGGHDVTVVLGTGSAWQPAEPIAVRRLDEPVPTVLVTDDGDGHRVALVLSHPLWSAPRIVGGVAVLSDQFVDGVIWTVESVRSSAATDALAAAVADLWERAQ